MVIRKKQILFIGTLLCVVWVVVLFHMYHTQVALSVNDEQLDANQIVKRYNDVNINEKILFESELKVEKMLADSQRRKKILSDEIKNINNHPLQSLEQIKEIVEKNTLQTTPVLVTAFNRVTVNRCIKQLIDTRTSKDEFPIIVSQDGYHLETSNVIDSFKDQVLHIHHDPIDVTLPAKEKIFLGYYKLAAHYKWALNRVFSLYPQAQTVIIVEDDLDISPDFFQYFRSTRHLLFDDPSLFCISAWNDNGKSSQIDVNAASLLYRTDFFPGLGWMLTRKFWQELEPKWPKSFWDDWLRDVPQRKGRSCIRPEVSRTKTFGKKGVSNGQFFDKHLKFIELNKIFGNFSNTDYLLKQNYDNNFLNKVYSCNSVSSVRDITAKKTKGPVRIEYSTPQQFKSHAKLLGIMDDFKAGVPRTAYLGVVTCVKNGIRVYIAPDRTKWKGYDES